MGVLNTQNALFEDDKSPCGHVKDATYSCLGYYKPLLAVPILAAPILAAPILAAPILAAPILAAPILAAQILAAPILAAPTLAAPMSSLYISDCLIFVIQRLIYICKIVFFCNTMSYSYIYIYIRLFL